MADGIFCGFIFVTYKSKLAIMERSLHEIAPGKLYVVDKCLFEELTLDLRVYLVRTHKYLPWGVRLRTCLFAFETKRDAFSTLHATFSMKPRESMVILDIQIIANALTVSLSGFH